MIEKKKKVEKKIKYKRNLKNKFKKIGKLKKVKKKQKKLVYLKNNEKNSIFKIELIFANTLVIIL